MASVFNRFAQGLELLWAEGDGNGFSSYLAGPLITGARGSERGTIQHGALADVTGVGQAGAQAVVLTLQGIGRGKFLFHAVILSWRSSLNKYIYLSCTRLSCPPSVPG